MAFIDNIRQISNAADKVKDNFLIAIRKSIETVAKNGYHNTGFSPDNLCEMATTAMGRGYYDSPLFETKAHPASVHETFELFEYACNDLRNQGFKIEAHASSNYIMFSITW